MVAGTPAPPPPDSTEITVTVVMTPDTTRATIHGDIRDMKIMQKMIRLSELIATLDVVRVSIANATFANTAVWPPKDGSLPG